MNVENHNIIINNYKESDSVCYSYVILKGTVLTRYNSPCNKLVKNLIIQNGTKNSTLQFYNNKFKCLICLNTGENNINIQYCCRKLDFKIYFQPKTTNFCVVPIYIICQNHDGTFQAPENEDNSTQSACDRISVGIRLIQSLIAEKFHEKGLRRKTFQLESDLYTTVPKCRVFHSQLDCVTARSMTQEELWSHFGREIIDSDLKNDDYKYLAFMSCTKYRGDKFGEDIQTHEDITGITEAHVALGGGGLALFGTACLYTWPKKVEDVMDYFLNEELVDRTKFMDDSCYRGTIGACFATTLGSVCHELCHTFDLGHTSDGIMGRGFDNIHKEFIFENFKKETKVTREKGSSTYIKDIIKVTQTVAPKREGIKYSPPVYKNGVAPTKNGIFWMENCTVLLYYHKWFNSHNPSDKCVLEFQYDKKRIYSSSGIRIVEIRDVASEMLVKWWDFSQDPQNIFILPNFKDYKEASVFILIAEDSLGNILKEEL